MVRETPEAIKIAAGLAVFIGANYAGYRLWERSRNRMNGVQLNTMGNTMEFAIRDYPTGIHSYFVDVYGRRVATEYFNTGGLRGLPEVTGIIQLNPGKHTIKFSYGADDTKEVVREVQILEPVP